MKFDLLLQIYVKYDEFKSKEFLSCFWYFTVLNNKKDR